MHTFLFNTRVMHARKRAAAAVLMACLFAASAFAPVLASPQAGPYEVVVTLQTVSPSPAYVGQEVTFTVKVAAVDPTAGIPGGVAEIRAGQDKKCDITLDAQGAGSCSLTFTQSGTVAIKAVYPGYNQFMPGVSAEVTHQVTDRIRSALVITAHTPDPSVINHAVAVEVSLPPAGAALTQPVTVYRGGTDCAGTSPDTATDRCTTALDVNGKGSCALTLTASGKVNLCAAYPGDVTHAQAVSAPVTQEVRSSNTLVAITKIEPSPVVMGSPAEVYYSVTSPDGTPAGTVTVSGGGATCSASVAAGRCALTLSQPHLQNITAAYAGSNAGTVTMQPSASDPVVLRVNAPPTELDLDAKKVEAVLPVGSLVANLTASDPNPDESLAFSLASGAGAEGNNYFAVDGSRLVLRSALPLWSSSVSLRLRVTDPAGLTFEQPFKLKVFIDNTTVLPVTGFAAGRSTVLPEQPRAQAYDRSADLQLEIPRLGVSADVVGVPAGGDGWDTTWLNREVGWLAGSAFPTWTGNSVLAGHNYLADGKPGPFDRLDSLKFGDELLVRAFGQTYTYEVRQVSQVSPGDLSVLKHEDKAWLTLITCRGFDEGRDTYTWRVVVRAVLKDVH